VHTLCMQGRNVAVLDLQTHTTRTVRETSDVIAALSTREGRKLLYETRGVERFYIHELDGKTGKHHVLFDEPLASSRPRATYAADGNAVLFMSGRRVLEWRNHSLREVASLERGQ